MVRLEQIQALRQRVDQLSFTHQQCITRYSELTSYLLEIVRHILTLSFGQRWEKQVTQFLRVFDRYRKNKAFK